MVAQLFEKHLSNQSSHYEKYNFRYKVATTCLLFYASYGIIHLVLLCITNSCFQLVDAAI